MAMRIGSMDRPMAQMMWATPIGMPPPAAVGVDSAGRPGRADLPDRPEKVAAPGRQGSGEPDSAAEQGAVAEELRERREKEGPQGPPGAAALPG
jgi:hypothetical protein